MVIDGNPNPDADIVCSLYTLGGDGAVKTTRSQKSSGFSRHHQTIELQCPERGGERQLLSLLLAAAVLPPELSRICHRELYGGGKLRPPVGRVGSAVLPANQRATSVQSRPRSAVARPSTSKGSAMSMSKSMPALAALALSALASPAPAEGLARPSPAAPATHEMSISSAD